MKKSSIFQGQADIRCFLSAYKRGDIEAGWALEEINRIAAFYANDRVDAYANTARRQIAAREMVKPKAPAVIALLFLLFPIFAPAQASTYREAMRMPPAKPPVEVAYRSDTTQVRKWKPVQPVAILRPRRVKSKCSISFIQPSFR